MLNLGLPGIDALEIIRQVRESEWPVPIIVLTSRTDEAGKVEALDLGAYDYVSKAVRHGWAARQDPRRDAASTAARG